MSLAAHARRLLVLVALAEGGLRGGQPRDRHAVRRAGDVVEADLWQKMTLSGSPPCSPQMPTLRSGPGAPAALVADLINWPTPSWSSTWNGSRGRIFALDVDGQEAAGVVAASSRTSSASGRWCRTRRTRPASAISSGGQRRARQLDHRADQVVDAHAASVEHLLGHASTHRRVALSSVTCRPAGS